MSTVNIDLTKRIGKMKVMHAVNNGPCVSSGVQTRGNQHDYKAARFMYEYNIDLIPRYMIIDQNGNIINDNAPRPSSEEIYTDLHIN